MNDIDLRHLDRRRLLGSVAALGVAAPLLAACGSDDEPSGSSTPASSSSSSSASDTPTEEPQGSGGGQELVATADVPVGGGVVLDDTKLVVTQPTEGDFKCFTAVCTHQGCLVGSVEDNVITCPCHGSQYSAEDGTVVTGPATGNLTPVDVTVKGGQIVES
jgi:Rieske Fe-S protein